MSTHGDTRRPLFFICVEFYRFVRGGKWRANTSRGGAGRESAHCLHSLSAGGVLSLQQRSTFYLRLSALRLCRDESRIKFPDVDMGSFNLRISNYAAQWALC